jgi:hypothetical protein
VSLFCSQPSLLVCIYAQLIFIFFCYVRYVQLYAGNQDTFFTDFSKPFKKLDLLGMTNLMLTEWAEFHP